jgi:lipoprotein NlpI
MLVHLPAQNREQVRGGEVKIADFLRAGAYALAIAFAPFANAHAAAVASGANTKALRYTVEPVPAWVVPARESSAALPEAAPMHYRIIDDQIRIEGRSATNFTRVVRVLNDAAGVSAASQLEIEFDPSYESVALHHVEVVRNGKRLNRLDRKRIQLLQRETQLEDQMYDGRITLSIVLEDIRVGDQIDFAYTKRGANPVFDGKFVQSEWMTTLNGPVGLRQVRLMAPLARVIRHQPAAAGIKVESKTAGTWRETIFRREATPQMRIEDHAPVSVLLPHQIQFTEFADWREVSRWGERLFAQDGPAHAVDQEAARIQAQTPDRAQQALAALQFVQKEIRYFGTEMGVNSHRPASPAKVLEQRFGDCKDKVSLLVALLARLGVESAPVLVSTRWRGDVEQLLPSPLAFDHVIARVQLDGKTYWLDPTRSHQAGPLEKRQSLGLGKGLVLVPSSQTLADLPLPFNAERMVVNDRIRFDSIKHEPLLESRITYHGELADAFRELATSRGLPALGTELASTYLRMYPKAQAIGSMQMESPSGEDAVTFVQTFSVGEFWSFPEERMLRAEVVAWSLAQVLDFPKAEIRRHPYAVSLPGIYRHTITVDFPENVYERDSSEVEEVGDGHFSLRTAIDNTPRRIAIAAELRLSAAQITPEEWKRVTEKADKASEHLSAYVDVSALRLDQVDPFKSTIEKLAEDLRSERVKVRTGQQAKAMLKIEGLSAQLAGGRLPPALEARVLRARGVQQDALGRAEAAKADFDRALALAPASSEIQTSAAVNAFALRDMNRAISLATEVLQRDPRDKQALAVRARARYFNKQLQEARTDYLALLQDSASVRRGFPLIWLSMTLRQMGQDPAKLQADYPADRLPTDWPRPLVDFALGKASADAVIQAAKASKNPAGSLCEAYFYVGEKYFAEGDLARAAEFWRKAADQGVLEFTEDTAARLRLADAERKGGGE